MLLLLLTLSAPDLSAQSRRNRRGNGPVYGARIEKQVTLPDSTTLARRDSLRQVDSLRRADSVALLGKSSLDVPAFSHAQDSMISDFSNGNRKIFYYGSTSVKYQDMELTADYMEYDMNAGTVYAHGVYDSLNGVWNGQPVMKQGNQTYNMEEVRYNFNSRKARIKNMITNDAEGILHGRDIKMMDDHSINLEHGKYTVCDDEHPHYYINLTMGKVISETKTTVFGPAYLVVEDVHIPFLMLPFGFIPKRPQRATGLLMPSFGEEERRGFYMRDLGMYFVFGNHFDLSLTGSYYTLGSWNVEINSRYRVNYKFSGNLGMNYSKNVTGDKGSPDYREYSDFSIKWSHSMDSKAHPGMSFSASVDFSTPTNNTFNSHSLEETVENIARSSITWSRNWNGITLSVSANHSQNSRTGAYSFSLPNINFNVPTFYPLRRKNRVGKERFYEKFSLGYRLAFTNRVDFNMKEEKVALDRAFLDRFQNSMSHDFSISLPSFQLFKYINVNPSVSYNQRWYFRKTEYAYDEETGLVEALPSHQFNTLGIYQNYSGSLSLDTRLYGMFNFGRHHRIQAIRHLVTPSLSFSVGPDLKTYANGFRTFEYTDQNGERQTFEYNIYGSGISAPGRSGSLNLRIGNSLEAKVRDFADTTGNGTKKVKLIDQLTFNTGYNFLAEKNKMLPLTISMSTRLFDKVTLNFNSSFSPYAVDEKGTTLEEFAVTAGQGLLNMQSANLSFSYSIDGKGAMNGYDGTGANNRGSSASDYYQRMYYHPVTGEYIPGGWLYYANPNAPWSLSFNGSVEVHPKYTLDEETDTYNRGLDFRASVNFSGSLKLTPKLNMNGSGTFDLIARRMSRMSINATYDLHCFNIAVSWIPVGSFKSYSFRIAANASALADLLRFKRERRQAYNW